MDLNRFWCVCALIYSGTSAAEISGEQPPFALTLEQVESWSQDAPFVSQENISSVPLARRIKAPLSADRDNLDSHAKVLYAPDGLNNLAGYLDTQPKFNLYNFTHWSQIDVLNFFGGTAARSIQIPSRPWVETAHKNGVKVLGSVFLAVAVYGGNADTVAQLLTQDERGNFVYADNLIEIANYYGFDGWLMNQETDLTLVKNDSNQIIEGKRDRERAKELAGRMLAFMKYFTAVAPQGMEIHWYDSMLPNGEVAWQNELNVNNRFFLQDDVPSADAMFINYWWNRNMVKNSSALAKKLNRSPYDLYFGADLWPGRNAQVAFNKTKWLSWLFKRNGQQAMSSIALFAPNLNYSFHGAKGLPPFSRFKQDPEDHGSFYATEQRLFVGDDLNLAVNDDSWPGIGRYLPAKSTINHLPFGTNFSTGQGKVMVSEGEVVGGAWTNMALQSKLPTWQFAVLGNPIVTLSYDFENVFDGGNSLRIEGDATQGEALIPLYQTDFQLHKNSSLELVFNGTDQIASVYLQTDNGRRTKFALSGPDGQQSEWVRRTYVLSEYAGEHITKIGLVVDKKSTKSFLVRVGRLTLK